MSAYTDDFNRANGSLGANWTKVTSANITGDVAIVSNEASGSVASQWGIYTYASSAATNDQYAQAVVPTVASGSQREVQLGVRVKLPVVGSYWPDGYFIGIQYTTSGASRYLFKYSGGNYSAITSASSPAFTAGETIRIEAQGSTIRYLLNGTAIFTQTDTTITGASERLLMMGIFGGSAGPATLDDFSAGDIGAAPADQPAVKRFGGIPHMRRGQQALW